MCMSGGGGWGPLVGMLAGAALAPFTGGASLAGVAMGAGLGAAAGGMLENIISPPEPPPTPSFQIPEMPEVPTYEPPTFEMPEMPTIVVPPPPQPVMPQMPENLGKEVSKALDPEQKRLQRQREARRTGRRRSILTTPLGATDDQSATVVKTVLGG